MIQTAKVRTMYIALDTEQLLPFQRDRTPAKHTLRQAKDSIGSWSLCVPKIGYDYGLALYLYVVIWEPQLGQAEVLQ